MNGPVHGFEWFLAEPIDVFLFRDGRPFSPEESHRATSLFPPMATTLQGAVRARIRADDPDAFHRLFPDGSYGKLEIRGSFLHGFDDGLDPADRVSLPAPRDLLLHGKSGGTATSMAPAGGLPGAVHIGWPQSAASADFRPLLATAGGTSAEGYWIGAGALSNYLGGAASVVLAGRPPARADPRVGIEISEGGTAEEGRIYVAEFQQMLPGTGIVVGVSGVEQQLRSTRPLLRLGGEGRMASFRRLPEPVAKGLTRLLQQPPRGARENISETGAFKLYVAAPAVFDNGWYPDFLDNDLRTVDGFPRARLVSAAVGKPVVVSGWDMEHRRPRPPHLAVPPGSVYYFESEIWDDGYADEVAEAFHGRCFSRLDPALGFGLLLVGAWTRSTGTKGLTDGGRP